MRTPTLLSCFWLYACTGNRFLTSCSVVWTKSSSPIFSSTSCEFELLLMICFTSFRRNVTITSPLSFCSVSSISFFLLACTGAMSESVSTGWSQSPHRRYSRMVDFPVPRPPITALYCWFNSISSLPRNFELDTLNDVIQRLGSSGSSCDRRDSFARHACRSASAVGSDHLTQVVCLPRSEWSRFRLSEV